MQLVDKGKLSTLFDTTGIPPQNLYENMIQTTLSKTQVLSFSACSTFLPLIESDLHINESAAVKMLSSPCFHHEGI